MVRVSIAVVPLTLRVIVAAELVTAMLAAVMFPLLAKLTLPTPGLNCHPVGGVKIRVWPVPAPKSLDAPSVMTMLPKAVKAAPLVELSALSAERLLPPVGDVMVTLAHTRGELNATNPRIRLRRIVAVFIV